MQQGRQACSLSVAVCVSGRTFPATPAMMTPSEQHTGYGLERGRTSWLLLCLSVIRCVVQAAEEALAKNQAEPIVAAAVALAAVVSVESPFIHVATIQVLITG